MSHAIDTDARHDLAGTSVLHDGFFRPGIVKSATPMPPLALTYAEKLLAEGEFERGLAWGLSTGNPAPMHARRAYAALRQINGYKSSAAMLTKPDAQTKLGKSERYALGLMLVPANGLPEEIAVRSGLRRKVNLCPFASPGCREACLSTSGHGAFANTQRARAVRTAFLLAQPRHAGAIIGAEIRAAIRAHGADNITLRLNVTSDIRWEFVAPSVLDDLSAIGVRVYDYTAWRPEDRRPELIGGYHLTYSAKESAHTLDAYLAELLDDGHNVAIPFMVRAGEELPIAHTLNGRTFAVINGDLSDDRTEDYSAGVGGRGVIVGLRVKGRAGKADRTGFIRTPLPIVS